MIAKILVPTDGSDHAGKAVQLAADLAGKYGAELILLHVLLRGHLDEGLKRFAEVENLAGGKPLAEAIAAIPEARFPVSMVPAGVIESSDALLSAVAEQVLRAARNSAKEHGAKQVREVIEDGDPAQCVLDLANSEEINLIVMGSRGLSDLEGLFVGSVSHKVSHLAPCTVMTVR